MAIIYSYDNQTGLSGSDTLLGTSSKSTNGRKSNETKNFKLADIADFINVAGYEGTPGRLQLLGGSGGPLVNSLFYQPTYSSSGNNVVGEKVILDNGTGIGSLEVAQDVLVKRNISISGTGTVIGSFTNAGLGTFNGGLISNAATTLAGDTTLNGSIIDYSGTRGIAEQVLVSDASGYVTWQNYQGSGLEFQGTWNASTDDPDLTAIALDPSNTGKYWVVSTDGSTSLSGITDWKSGDWAIISENNSGTIFWDKIDNSPVLTGAGTPNNIAMWGASNNILTNSPLVYNPGGNGEFTTGTASLTAMGIDLGGNELTLAIWNTAYNNGLNFGYIIDTDGNTGVDDQVLSKVTNPDGEPSLKWVDQNAGISGVTNFIPQINSTGDGLVDSVMEFVNTNTLTGPVRLNLETNSNSLNSLGGSLFLNSNGSGGLTIGANTNTTGDIFFQQSGRTTDKGGWFVINNTGENNFGKFKFSHNAEDSQGTTVSLDSFSIDGSTASTTGQAFIDFYNTSLGSSTGTININTQLSLDAVNISLNTGAILGANIQDSVFDATFNSTGQYGGGYILDSTGSTGTFGGSNNESILTSGLTSQGDSTILWQTRQDLFTNAVGVPVLAMAGTTSNLIMAPINLLNQTGGTIYFKGGGGSTADPLRIDTVVSSDAQGNVDVAFDLVTPTGLTLGTYTNPSSITVGKGGVIDSITSGSGSITGDGNQYNIPVWDGTTELSGITSNAVANKLVSGITTNYITSVTGSDVPTDHIIKNYNNQGVVTGTLTYTQSGVLRFSGGQGGRIDVGANAANINDADLNVGEGKATFKGGVIISNSPGGVQVDNSSLVVGSGTNDIIAGSDHCLTVGSNNQITSNSDQSVAFGQGNSIAGSIDAFAVGNSNSIISSNRTQVLGFNNTATSSSSFVAGGANSISATSNVFALGDNHTVSGTTQDAYLLGTSNTITGGTGSFAIGNNIDGDTGNHMVIGYRNDKSSYPATDYALGLGNTKFALSVGSTTTTDSNAIIITEGGVNRGGGVAQIPRVVLPTILNFNFADDTAAAAGGIPVGGLYHNAGVIRIRLT